MTAGTRRVACPPHLLPQGPSDTDAAPVRSILPNGPELA